MEELKGDRDAAAKEAIAAKTTGKVAGKCVVGGTDDINEGVLADYGVLSSPSLLCVCLDFDWEGESGLWQVGNW